MTEKKFPENFRRNHANIWRNISTGTWADSPEIRKDVAKSKDSFTFKI
ncbi:hypothetical protein [Flavobacterium foetidum]|nr:hypothetical protein [Flavobacterium foetidum]KAF2514263.1 hypothetical protein E0W73_12725 [Flavobacterium foetidum]